MLDVILDDVLRDLIVHDGVLGVEKVGGAQDRGHKGGVLHQHTYSSSDYQHQLRKFTGQ